MPIRIRELGFTAIQSCVVAVTVGTVGVTAMGYLGSSSQTAIVGAATASPVGFHALSSTPPSIGMSAQAGAGRVAAKAAQVAQDVAQAVDGPYKRIPLSTTPRPIPAKFAQLREVLDGITQRAELAPQRQVPEAVRAVFGQSSGAELFGAGLADIRDSIGVRLFEDIQVTSKKLDRGDTNSRLVLALAEIAKGQTSAARKMLDEIEEIYQAGDSNFRVQSTLIERLRVLNEVFDDSIRRIDSARVAEAFEGKLRSIPSIAQDGPPSTLLRTLKRYDGRTSRYVLERTRRLFATDSRFGSEFPPLDEKTQKFYDSAFVRERNRLQGLFKDTKETIVSDRRTNKSERRYLTPEPLYKIDLAVRRGDAEQALEILEALRDQPILFRGGDTLDRAEALDQLENAIISVAPRFIPADQYFPARFRSQRFDLARPPSDLPAPVLRLAESLRLQIQFKYGIELRRGFVDEDLQDALSEVFRASIRGDEEAIPPMMSDLRNTILSKSEDFDLLEKDLIDFARLFREGRDRLGERRLSIKDDRNMPKELQEPASRLAIELADGLSRAE